MTTETLTLSQFLLERLSDDEAVALAAIPASSADWAPESYRVVADGEWEVAEASVPSANHIARHDPARVLATCKAHRAIVELHPMVSARDVWGTEVDGWACEVCDLEPDLTLGGVEFARSDGCKTLRALASIYADHPSFDPRWAL